MSFAVSLPWWALTLVFAAVLAVAWGSYAGAIVPLSRRRRAALMTLRAVALGLLVACLLRPVRLMPPDSARDAVLPILVDVSRSMRLDDGQGGSRLDRAGGLVQHEIVPALAGRYATEVWTFGDTLARAGDGALAANGSRSDLATALRDIRERYRDRPMAGVIVISDGGETGGDPARVVDDGAAPIYTVGVGSSQLHPDLEVVDVTAGDAAIEDASVDLTVSAINRGSAGAFDVRLLENGQPIDLRSVTPSSANSPVRAVFTVSPSAEAATLYTIEIPAGAGEPVVENNRRSVLVQTPGRRRRILIVEGAPGFEHSFMKRALTADPGLEIDSVVRKGRDAQGDATFFVQAAAERAPLLGAGFPNDREALFAYDAVVLANVDPEALSGVELQAVADFVAVRGGGLLVLGAKSFAQQGLARTALEEVLPVALSGRDIGVLQVAARARSKGGVVLTADGEAHPAMRIGANADENARRWRAVPSLAGASTLGAPRPGAQVLAVLNMAGAQRPLVAVQRYGQGRSMIFAGEASWRWRMQMPASERTYELFWRQAARWLASGAPDAVAVSLPATADGGETSTLVVDVRGSRFEPLADADVEVRMTTPGGDVRQMAPSLLDAATGRYGVDVSFDDPGIYRIEAEARRGGAVIGAARQSLLVGGFDREFADPRLNEDVLRRVALASGGSYFPADSAGRLPALLASTEVDPGAPRVQELWHNVWIFAAVVLMVSLEWMLRRRWGLR